VDAADLLATDPRGVEADLLRRVEHAARRISRLGCRLDGLSELQTFRLGCRD
jgi:hypothetical protein